MKLCNVKRYCKYPLAHAEQHKDLPGYLLLWTTQLLMKIFNVGAFSLFFSYSKTKEMHQFLKFILFCSSTLHILDGLSVHHQESKTVHTASGVCERDSADCLLAGTR